MGDPGIAREGEADIGAEQPPIPVSPPSRDRWPVVRRWLLAAAALASIGTATAAALSGRPMFAVAAVIFVLLPIGYLLAFAVRGSMSRPLGAAAAAALAVVVAGSTVFAVVGCGQRLEPRGDLAGCDLRGEELAGIDLTGADLAGADLSGANLRQTTLDQAVLTGANLQHAGLDGTSLRATYLDGAILRETDLTAADLRPATMAGASLDGANLEGLDLAGVSLRAATLRGANLAAANLAGADLSDAVLDGAVLDGANLSEAFGVDDGALTSALGVATEDLGAALSEREIRLEPRDAILAALGAACEGRGVNQAAPYPQGSFRPMVILDAGGAKGPETERAAQLGWEPMAVRFAQLVACVGPEEEIVLEACPYQGGGSFATLTRIQLRRDYRVVEAASGKAVLEEALEGSAPKPCPPRYVFPPTSLNESLFGSDVGFGKIEAELAALVGP